MEDSITVTRLEEGDDTVCLLIEGLPYDTEAFPTILARSRWQIRREMCLDFVALPDFSAEAGIKLKFYLNMAYAQKLGMEPNAYMATWADSTDELVDYYRHLAEDISARLLAGNDWSQIIKDQFPGRESEKVENAVKVVKVLIGKKTDFSTELASLNAELSDMEVNGMTIFDTNVFETDAHLTEARLVDPEQLPPLAPGKENPEKPPKARKPKVKKRPNKRPVPGVYHSSMVPV